MNEMQESSTANYMNSPETTFQKPHSILISQESIPDSMHKSTISPTKSHIRVRDGLDQSDEHDEGDDSSDN